MRYIYRKSIKTLRVFFTFIGGVMSVKASGKDLGSLPGQGRVRLKTPLSGGRRPGQARTPPSRRAAGTRPAPGGTGGPCSWGGRRTPRRHRSPRRSTPRAACRCRTLRGSRRSTPPSGPRSPASRTTSASRRCHKSGNGRRRAGFRFQNPCWYIRYPGFDTENRTGKKYYLESCLNKKVKC